MNDMTCPTVRVKSGDSFCIINESDFDPTVHVKFNAPILPPPPASLPPPPPPGPVDPLDNLASDWRKRDDLRQLAAAVSGRSVENKAQAIAVIEAALKARA